MSDIIGNEGGAMSIIDDKGKDYELIARSLAKRFDTIYYVDMETDHYSVFSSSAFFKETGLPESGISFFDDVLQLTMNIVHPDDMEILKNALNKKMLMWAIGRGGLLPLVHRVKMDSEYVYMSLDAMWAVDHRHLIVGVMNVNESEKNKRSLEESNRIYSDITNSLAHSYESIYYVDSQTDEYILFTSTVLYLKLGIPRKGNLFFDTIVNRVLPIINPEDQQIVKNSFVKENMLQVIDRDGFLSITPRLKLNGVYVYTNLRALWADDHKHIIITISNVDKQTRWAMEQEKVLKLARQKALVDVLTGVKNRNAYCEQEFELQKMLDDGVENAFAIVMCDVNGLKNINDTEGHRKGDEYLQNTCRMLQDIYSHSQVFRLGGDEFAVILLGEDYDNRQALLKQAKATVLENQQKDKPVFAIGMAEYRTGEKVSDVFEHADQEMYLDKQLLKTKN